MSDFDYVIKTMIEVLVILAVSVIGFVFITSVVSPGTTTSEIAEYQTVTEVQVAQPVKDTVQVSQPTTNNISIHIDSIVGFELLSVGSILSAVFFLLKKWKSKSKKIQISFNSD